MAQAFFPRLRRRAVRLGVLLAFALVLAQTAAVIHTYSHLRAGNSAAGLPASSSLCPDCLSFAPLRVAADAVSSGC